MSSDDFAYGCTGLVHNPFVLLMFSFGNEISLQVWNNHGSRPHVYILISVNDPMNNGLGALCDASRMLAICEEQHEPSLFLDQYFRFRPQY